MAGRVHQDEVTRWQRSVQVVSNGFGRNHILRTLQNKRWCVELRQVSTVILQKRDTRELFRNLGVGPAKAIRELCPKRGAVRIPHHDWCHTT